MSGQWERYVEQAAKVAYESGAPVWPWDRLSPGERAPRVARMRAALSVVGPLIAEDTRVRMVEAAGRALDRGGCEPGPTREVDLLGELDKMADEEDEL